MVQNGIEKILSKNPIIPVATIRNKEELELIIDKIIQANIQCIEVTLRTDFAYQALEIIKSKNLPNFDLGVGTITRADQIAKVQEIGVDFIVSPGLTPKLAQHLKQSSIAFIPGVSTVSDIMKGMEEDFRFFKFFPANLFGGIQAIKTYGQLFPHISFCPTGGISEETHQEYLYEPNILSVGGSWMLK
jgi:2-dehydro-3-deoxyphosphogluconate aldolase/(4S)-4-hydroxy-2-oxoglutarate aldolase